ncbi:CoA transferase [Alcaligenaceae bacterium]|nr:CoA transferase [Alcaligenaceae bacterium]
MERNGPLAGLRIVDLSSVLLGPFCTLILGDMGADVVKVETLSGDSTRSIGPARHAGMSAVFLSVNRNKRSIALDLKHPDGRAALLDLLRDADVFITNVRRKPLGRLGLSYEEVAAVNKEIIYCNAVGYAEGGPLQDEPAYDDIVQANSGIAALQAYFSGAPQYVATVMADKGAGMMAALAIMAAVRHREQTGKGQKVEVPMYESMVWFTMTEHLYGHTFVPPQGATVYPRPVSKFRRPYRTQDGYLAVVPYNDKQWLRFFKLIGQEELAADPRFISIDQRTLNIDALYGLLEDAIAQGTTAHWVQALGEIDIPAYPVRHPDELMQEPQLVATGFFRELEHPSEGPIVMMDSPMKLSDSPIGVRRHAPRLGEHSRELLTEIGYSKDKIVALATSGAILIDDTDPASTVKA